MSEPDDVVLVDPAGRVVGRMDRTAAHSTRTPRHLAFSLYLFDDGGDVLVTRRALSKRTWPGVWTNTCCGHPRPGEAWPDAAVRRLGEELGLEVTDLDCVLPEFSYRARDPGGVLEDEWCPTFTGRVRGAGIEPRPDPGEVMDWAWTPLRSLVAAGSAAPYAFSPWAVAQLPLLEPLVRRATAANSPRESYRRESYR